MTATSTRRRADVREVVVTGVGLALPGVATPGDLLGLLPGEGGFDPVTGLVGRELRHKDRASRLALRAAEFALHDAALADADGLFTGAAGGTAVVVSTNFGNADSVCGAVDTIAAEGVTGLSPLGLPQTSSNVIAGWVAIRYRLGGPNLTVSNGATSGLDAVAWARNLIVAGRAEAAIVVGVEPGNHVVTKILGEQSTDAAVAVVLEPADAAASRGARPRATITGYARTRNLTEALVSTGEPAEGPVGLWLTDGAEPAGTTAGRLLAAARRIDLESQLGPLSGALGVLQCAAAAAHLASGASGNALATAGGPRHDATAALLLAPPRALRPSTQERGQHP
ncbi:beta-ketoacyl synthase N-terminal-like domain-containing protein (plasmid) [Streptomyces sp. AM 4-1-1]|uniref:beta-ketoacyl synthase N-terminal-like domain-containing protein n=1 Tax=Streptomyces sp. AM 4-1-1 TaxID=3028710 RepID=UPI0023B98DCF|nr:beta-ketoacyl synthase N-terminal-like domain-containing protein [Streptomyces sp. AM 4-1-1]WEH37859.1 beta-ketoacyl synthase N-terminal-like domain-containing protein [Streptomyces sp. AM 4-1-1]